MRRSPLTPRHRTVHPVVLFMPLFTALLLSLLAGSLTAQQRSVLRVLSADQLTGRTVGDVQMRELIGNVRMMQDSVLISCDRAIQNITRNSAELRGNVVIRQDTLELRTERGFYNGDTRLASSRSGVWLNDGHVTLTAKIGTYDTDRKIADFVNDVTVEDTAATITARKMRYIRDSSLVVAHDSVRIRFKDENVLIVSDSVRHYPDAQRSEFYHDPILWQVDTAYVAYDDYLMEIDSLDLDTLFIAADFMLALRDSANTFLTEGNVRLVREGLAARSASALFHRSDSLIHLRGDPILWYDENQITGDSITAQLADNKLRQLDVVGAAFSASRSKPAESDTLYPPDRFDQTSGKRIQMFFTDGEAERIRVEETAISLYYLYDDGALNGVRRESSDLIIIDFKDGQVDELRSIRGVEGTYYPEKYVTGSESTYNLDGFEWREDRPVMIPVP